MLTLEHLARLVAEHKEALAASVRTFTVTGTQLTIGDRATIMGVINLSADSWYRESVCTTVDAAVRRGQVMAAQGAGLVDAGAESTLAQADRADATLQNSKLLPVIQGLRASNIPVSVETYEPEVVIACLEAGANVLNLTGNYSEESIFRCVADHDATVILCHVQGEHVRDVGEFDLSSDPVSVMYEGFARQIEFATKCGVTKLMIDPGMGFYYRNLQDSAMRVRHQMRTFLNTFRLRALGWPICHALPHAFDFFGEEVRCAEPFFAVLAALGRTDVFRTHEVPRVKAVLDTMGTFE